MKAYTNIIIYSTHNIPDLDIAVYNCNLNVIYLYAEILLN